MKNNGLSACKSPNGISVMPVNGQGDTEVCLFLEAGLIHVHVYHFGRDEPVHEFSFAASTR